MGRLTDATESVTLHNTLETLTFGGTDDIYKLSVVEQLHRNGITEVVVLIKLELGQVLLGRCAGLLIVSLHRLGGILLLNLAETQLNSLVTILLNGLNLGYNTRTSFDNSARHVLAVGTENGCHSDFLS